jgi:hypothetical protein
MTTSMAKFVSFGRTSGLAGERDRTLDSGTTGSPCDGCRISQLRVKSPAYRRGWHSWPTSSNCWHSNEGNTSPFFATCRRSTRVGRHGPAPDANRGPDGPLLPIGYSVVRPGRTRVAHPPSVRENTAGSGPHPLPGPSWRLLLSSTEGAGPRRGSWSRNRPQRAPGLG